MRQCGTGAGAWGHRGSPSPPPRLGHSTVRAYRGGGTGAANPQTQMRDAGCGISEDAETEKGETEKEDGPSFYGLKGVLKNFWAKI